MKLEDVKTKDLEKELAKRKRESNRPKRKDIKDINFSNIISTMESVIDDVINGDYYEDDDDDTYLAEACYTAFYGEDFFKWFNKNT
jgi:hypothetical protein